MFGSTQRVDVADTLDTATELLEQQRRERAAEQLLTVSDFINRFLKEHNALYTEQLEETARFARNVSPSRLRSGTVRRVREGIRRCFRDGAAYLIRHSEPTPTSYGESAAKDLSTAGVEQLYGLAKRLLDELLLCPRDVVINVLYSPKNRTKKSAKYTVRALKKKWKRYATDVQYTITSEETLFYSVLNDIDDEGVERLVQRIRSGNADDEDFERIQNVFRRWISEYPGAKDVAKRLKQLLNDAATENGRFRVCLYFSHENMLATVLYHYLGLEGPGNWPGHAEFIKQEDGQMLYRDHWYDPSRV